MTTIEHVTYLSAGLRCTADLYLPDTDRPVPGVVCAESGAKVKEMMAEPARYLTDAGFAVLAIDYRSFGGSEGEPRGQMFPAQQADDVRNAVSWLRGRPEIDAERIGLWGNSLAGSVVIAAAVIDRRVRAVVAKSPLAFDGWRSLLTGAGTFGFASLRTALAQDAERRAAGQPGATVPWLNFGAHGDTVGQSFADLGQDYPSFRNEILLESHERMLQWAPGHFIDRLAPTPLLIVTNGGPDAYHDLGEIQIAYAKAGEPKQLTLLPYDAMGLYAEPGLGEAMRASIDWFDTHLRRAALPQATAPAAGARA